MKTRNLKKVSLGVMALAMSIGFATTSTSALTTDVTENGTTNVPVTATIDSQFTVSIPKTLDLSSKTTTYDIAVSGDIASNEKLKVTPLTTVEMTEENTLKTAINATVTQDKKEWNFSDVSSSTATSGTISANLTAGEWAGTLAFNITLE